MIIIVDKTLTTTDTDTLTGVITDVTLLLTTNDNRVSCLSVDLPAPDADQFIALNNVTDTNLLDWVYARTGTTASSTATWHETIPTVPLPDSEGD